MNAELIAVGSELLGAGRRDTNAHWLGERLGRLGIAVAARGIVVDEVDRIAAILRAAIDRADLVIVTGGLGPTADDVTREAVALAVGRPLELDDEQVRRLRRRFAAFGRRFGREQLKQALLPPGASWIENPVGSAPGYRLAQGACTLWVLPGVPAEMEAMFEASIAPDLEARERSAFAHAVLKVAGRTEPSVDREVADLYRTPGAEITILSGIRGIELILRVVGSSTAVAHAALERLVGEIRSRLGSDLFGRDDETLPGIVGRMLVDAGETVATAESCTAGLLGATLTGVPGSSAWFRGGLIVYDDELKVRLAGVSPRLLAEHGAVSEAAAHALAAGARRVCGAEVGVGITGIAGPDGGTADKPVGSVHMAIADAEASEHGFVQLPGDREAIRGRTVTLAIDRLRRRLLGRRKGPVQ